MKTILQTLTSAYEKIQDPINWTQGALARDASGKEVLASSSKAACWCAAGAIRSQFGWLFASRDSFPMRESLVLLDSISCDVGSGLTMSFVNDGDLQGDAHATVLHIYEEAILHARNAGV